jgi:hypothetical protein
VIINENDAPNPELMKQLESLNISINTAYIFLLSILINIQFLYSEKARVITEINGTTLPSLNHLPILSNRLLILGLAIAIKTNLEDLNNLLSLEDSEENRTAIEISKHSLLSSVLGYIAAGISHGNLLAPPTIL